MKISSIVLPVFAGGIAAVAVSLCAGLLFTYNKEEVTALEGKASTNISTNHEGREGTEVGAENGVIICTDGSSENNTSLSENSSQNENKETIHIVKPTDTLSGISGKYGISVDRLVEVNHIKNPNLIYDDSAIIIPKE